MENCDTVEGLRPGMNLTWATRQGILCHTRYSERDYPYHRNIPEDWEKMGYSSKEKQEEMERNGSLSLLRLITPEAQVVDIADEIAYLTHDLEDCQRAGIFRIEEVHPEKLRDFMGARRKNALNDLIGTVCDASVESIKACEVNPEASVKIEYPSAIKVLVIEVRRFFEDHIFWKDEVRRRNEEGQDYIRKLFNYWTLHPPEGMSPIPVEIARYIARKTDQEIIHDYQLVFPPRFI